MQTKKLTRYQKVVMGIVAGGGLYTPPLDILTNAQKHDLAQLVENNKLAVSEEGYRCAQNNANS